MNTHTQRKLIALCRAIQTFARANSMAETSPLARICEDAIEALQSDETIVETETTNSQP